MTGGPIRAFSAALALALAGCTTVGDAGASGRPAPARPRPAQPAPAGARADALVMNVDAAPLDTDGNGYADLIRATVHLFDTRYPPPIHEDGACVFSLYACGAAGRPGSQALRQWRFAEGELAAARGRSRFGDCYRFQLSLIEGGGDAIEVSMADLSCRFEPVGGERPTLAGGVATIQIGRRVAMP